jgi:hypothetical protein
MYSFGVAKKQLHLYKVAAYSSSHPSPPSTIEWFETRSRLKKLNWF